jgi:hypothetical protein
MTRTLAQTPAPTLDPAPEGRGSWAIRAAAATFFSKSTKFSLLPCRGTCETCSSIYCPWYCCSIFDVPHSNCFPHPQYQIHMWMFDRHNWEQSSVSFVSSPGAFHCIRAVLRPLHGLTSTCITTEWGAFATCGAGTSTDSTLCSCTCA